MDQPGQNYTHNQNNISHSQNLSIGQSGFKKKSNTDISHLFPSNILLLIRRQNFEGK
jgi:hypothetical protein